MTYDQFLEALSKTPRDWFITRNGDIRRPGEETWLDQQCPISTLGGVCAADWWRVARRLGLDMDLAHEIVVAADRETSTLRGDQLALRKQLCLACGLKEDR